VTARGYTTGELVFQEDGTRLWRMAQDEGGLYVENMKSGKLYRFVLKEDGKD
jgi:hypothetical protein